MKEAVSCVIQGAKCRMVAKKFNLSHQTLARYVQKYKQLGEGARMRPNYEVRKVFSTEQEKMLVDYIIKSAQMMYGLTYADIRNLAFDLASKNDLQRPASWDEHESAGKEWLVGFMKRHKNLSLRTAEGCSLGRAISFNPTNVNRFYDLLESVIRRFPQFADGTRVYNLDEKGTETVQKSAKVVAETGSSQVSRIKSQERGTLVTTCAIICADGTYIPPAMVFPRVKFKQHMLNGAVPGTLGLANKTGWMTRKLFVEVMKHFIKHTRTSLENPSLLIYDNHESHLSIEALDLAKSNGVTVLTIPPHCSNKLQPLDVAVFRSFGNAYDAALNSHTLQNPNTNITIYQVAEFVKRANDRSMTRNNIASSFRATGIFPFDRNIFTEEDFLPSTVSDRPDPAGAETEETVNQTTIETSDDFTDVRSADGCVDECYSVIDQDLQKYIHEPWKISGCYLSSLRNFSKAPIMLINTGAGHDQW
ncbi:conserved hypothetical protein [Culex quinquefasciatus]|uniref:HTH CENPB-type domain-containing protein n=1 Tax=Culex quinquefasciatus TaxID=7176 RepID=B0XH60_CULQU|nr:conserved hypothetical protein [Culex quinquefasciatus]|eukprot:XP_001868982.1 conserved hypothetical protein [Culex quinquefasciatus]